MQVDFLMQNSWVEAAIEIKGLITLEDVIEKMINLQILDEDDNDRLIAMASNARGKSIRQTIGNGFYSKSISIF